MCGRYALTTPPEMLAALLHLHRMRFAVTPRYNIAPTQDVAVVRAEADGERELVGMHWGLIPFWAKDRGMGSKLINARSESADGKPAFRQSFQKRRCVIPASGFYEWKKSVGGEKRKQPYYITRKTDAPLMLAGLWESWADRGTGERVESCTILTTAPNAFLHELHDRMPVVLDEPAWNVWLDPRIENAGDLKPLLKPAPNEWFTMHPVSTRVNTSKVDEPSLLEAVPLMANPAPDVAPKAGRSKLRKKADDGQAGLFD